MGFYQAFETVRHKLPLIDHAVIAQGTHAGIPHDLGQRSMTEVLKRALLVSGGEAARRVRAAEHLGERRTLAGVPLDPIRPHLAAAQRDGLVSPEQVRIIDTALRTVDRGFPPADVDGGERLLVEQARLLQHTELKLVADRVVEAIDPDGTLPPEQVHRDRRFLHLRPHADGSWRGEFCLTPELGAKLKALLDPLAAPRTTRVDTGEGATVATDDRSPGQRRHDALEDLCDRLLRTPGLPEAGGTPTTVIILIDADTLRQRSGVGHLSDGTPMAAATVADLADQADVAWAVKDRSGAILEFGRSRRIATATQTLALIARDGGWTCHLNADRLPAWTPPRWVDQQQRPVVHPRILITRWQAQPPFTNRP